MLGHEVAHDMHHVWSHVPTQVEQRQEGQGGSGLHTRFDPWCRVQGSAPDLVLVPGFGNAGTSSVCGRRLQHQAPEVPIRPPRVLVAWT